MRISFFVPRCTPDNSHGRYVIELVKRFSPEHDVTVHAAAFSPAIPRSVYCRFLPVPNRPAAARLAALWGMSYLASKNKSVDITHIQGADAPVGNVVTAHSCNGVMRRAQGRRSSLRRSINYRIGAAAERFCLSRLATQRIIAVSDKVRQEIQLEYGIPQEKIAVIPNGVDAREFHPSHRSRLRASVRREFGFGLTDFVVLFVGGDYYLKGLPTLFKAAQRLPGIRLLVVGADPDETLVRLSHQYEVSGSLTFVRRTLEIVRLYSAVDCFALPTHYDTFSLATLEAMACGLPVIVSRAAGVSEFLTNGRDCLVVDDPVDAEGLAHGLRRIWNDAEFRTNLETEARRTAERYSWDDVATQTLEVYRQVFPGRKDALQRHNEASA